MDRRDITIGDILQPVVHQARAACSTYHRLSFRTPFPNGQQRLHAHRELSINRLPVMNRPRFYPTVDQSRRDAGQRGRLLW